MRIPSAAREPIDFSLIFHHRRLHTHGYKTLHQRSDRPQCKHLFHKITSLDMIRLYLTLKYKDKDKYIGHSPKHEQAKGMPLPKEISLLIPVLWFFRSMIIRRRAWFPA